MKRVAPPVTPKRVATTLPAIIKQRGIPEWVRQIVREVAAEYGVAMIHVLTACRRAEVCLARYAAIYRVKRFSRRTSAIQIGEWFGRDHASVFFALARHAEITGRPALTTYALKSCANPKRKPIPRKGK